MKPFYKSGVCRGLALALALAWVVCVAGPAAADDCKRISNILVLFDGSGNMKGKAYEALVQQMDFFSQAIPVTADGFFDVGIRHYGLRVGMNCDNTEKILAVGPWDPERFMNSFPKTVSYGVSSLATGLRAAADDVAGLPGKSVIIVVGSGHESCRGDPVKITQQIVANNPDLEIHTFQIGGGQDGSFFLRGIAEMGRGTFTSLEGVNSPAGWHAWMKRYLVQACAAAAPTPMPVVVGPVSFDMNSSSIRSKDPAVDAANQASLAAVAQVLRSNPSATVVLHGFVSDGRKSAKADLKLARKRAEAVAQHLVQTYHIPSSQIGMVAHGEAGRQGPRTVEFEMAR